MLGESNSSEALMSESLLEHYVYALLDPIDDSVFYIGKGTGQRAKAHEMEFVREFEKYADEAAEELATKALTEKQQKIRAIRERGDMVKQIVLGRYRTKSEAFAVEATLIEWVYGFDNLTNIVRGHGAKFIRPLGNLAELPGIDIEKKQASYDGSYSAERYEGLEKAGSYEVLQKLREQVSVAGFEVSSFEGHFKVYDPGESNGYIGFIVTVYGVDVLVQVSKANRPSLKFLFTESTCEYLEELANLVTLAKPSNVRNGRPRYIQFKDPELNLGKNDTSVVLAWLHKLRQHLA